MSIAIAGSVATLSAEVVGRWAESEDVDPQTVAWLQAGTALLTGLAVSRSGPGRATAMLTAAHYAAQALGAPDFIGQIIDVMPATAIRALLPRTF